jgi:hypothetical protein
VFISFIITAVNILIGIFSNFFIQALLYEFLEPLAILFQFLPQWNFSKLFNDILVFVLLSKRLDLGNQKDEDGNYNIKIRIFRF